MEGGGLPLRIVPWPVIRQNRFENGTPNFAALD